MPDVHVRSYLPHDLDALYDICLRTGDAGEDATGLVHDGRLLGEVYAAPYAVIEPELASVVDDGSGAAKGYVLGARHTVAFAEECERRWWPALRERYPLRHPGPDDGLDALLVALIHDRGVRDLSALEGYPSHLHINLLPQVRGAGWGRGLLDRLFDQLVALRSPGVHLGVSVRNERAIGFYEHVGFVEIHSDGITVTYGLRL